jgi:threonine dehydrogenase-like Zn-dependent dehydrogenase
MSVRPRAAPSASCPVPEVAEGIHLAVMVRPVRAVTVIPGRQGSVTLMDMPEPPDDDGPVLVQTQAVGICGTDLEIINGEYGSAPPGQDRLIIGHESLGRVLAAPPGTGFDAGDLVVGIVRRRDPVPCPACAAGQWDMCSNGRYTERGIKGRHGYASERYRIHPGYLVAVDPALGILGVLLEPTTVVAKAWDHIEKIGHRAAWAPEKVLITGAGPIGLLAALLSVQRGYETYVFDRVIEDRKPEMVRRLGATYVHRGHLNEAAAVADIVIECTGHVQMLLEAGPRNVRYRITCLTGISAAGTEAAIDPGLLNRNLVLQNSVIFGSVNANRDHYELAATALAQADPGWLADLITNQVPLDRWKEAYARESDDIKAILTFTDTSPQPRPGDQPI